MIKVLITGITGFVGSHLADYLLKKLKQGEAVQQSLLQKRSHPVVRGKYQLRQILGLKGELPGF